MVISRRKKMQKIIKIFIIFLILCFFVVSLFYSDQTKAMFADNILRPLFGNTKTITLEAIYLNTVDKGQIFKNELLHSKAQGVSIHKPAQKYSSSLFSLNNLRPILTNDPVKGEGIWDTLKVHSGEILLAKTFLRVDSNRPTNEVSIIKMNMNDLTLHLVAGTHEPGGLRHPGKGKIPAEIVKSSKLVAAFNGGFQQKDGHYGFIIGDQTYLPLQKNIATLLIPYNKPLEIVRFEGGPLDMNAIEAVRQNCPILIENGVITTDLPAWNAESWGLTITNSMFTWRSGLGVTKNRNLLYAAGPYLSPETLAIALQKAGAVNAMQLDINFPWIRYTVFTYQNGMNYGKPIRNQMLPNKQYFTGYNKDFFYLTKK